MTIAWVEFIFFILWTVIVAICIPRKETKKSESVLEGKVTSASPVEQPPAKIPSETAISKPKPVPAVTTNASPNSSMSTRNEKAQEKANEKLKSSKMPVEKKPSEKLKPSGRSVLSRSKKNVPEVSKHVDCENEVSPRPPDDEHVLHFSKKDVKKKKTEIDETDSTQLSE